VRPYALLIAALLAAAVLARAEASIQGEMLCVEPDIEFPVPCDSDED
jgi:hypothetical protein